MNGFGINAAGSQKISAFFLAKSEKNAFSQTSLFIERRKITEEPSFSPSGGGPGTPVPFASIHLSRLVKSPVVQM
jgi:hypothetical protein